MSTEGFYVSQLPPLGVRVAQAVGLTASAYLFGQNASFSYASMPAVLQAPAPLAAKQWATVFHAGHALGPPLAIISGLALGYVAWHQDPSSLSFKLNVAAAVALPSIYPFTIVFIKPTNTKIFAKEQSLAASSLEDKAVEAGISKEETTHALIDKWATLNFVRSLIVGFGAVCAVWAAVDKREIAGFTEIALATGANRLG